MSFAVGRIFKSISLIVESKFWGKSFLSLRNDAEQLSFKICQHTFYYYRLLYLAAVKSIYTKILMSL